MNVGRLCCRGAEYLGAGCALFWPCATRREGDRQRAAIAMAVRTARRVCLATLLLHSPFIVLAPSFKKLSCTFFNYCACGSSEFGSSEIASFGLSEIASS